MNLALLHVQPLSVACDEQLLLSALPQVLLMLILQAENTDLAFQQLSIVSGPIAACKINNHRSSSTLKGLM